MVLGFTRPKPRPAIADLPSFDPPPLSPSHAWHSERGEILFETACDVVGGFPGYARVGGRLRGHRLRVTERYLLVGDGSAHGFGLPIRQLDGSAFIPIDDHEDYALRIFYRDGLVPRLFTLQFQGMRLPSRGGLRAERAQLSLLRAGFHDRYADSPPSFQDYAVSWEETASFEFENVLWRGEAIVPLAVGLDGIPGTVWLTTRSLIWGCDTAPGVQRIPIAHLTDIAVEKLSDRDETPALYVGVGDESTGHFDLPFIFNQQSTPDHNLRDRGALLVGLRSRGLPIGHPTAPRQPWWDRSNESFPSLSPLHRTSTDDGVAVITSVLIDDLPEPLAARPIDYPEWPEATTQLPELIWEADSADPTEGDVETATSPATVLDIVLAEWSAEPSETPTADQRDVQLATSWIAPLTEEPTESGELATTTDEVVASTPPPPSPIRPVTAAPPPPRPFVTAYETASEAALAELETAIRNRATGRVTPITTALPSAADQAEAIAELTSLKEGGKISSDDLRERSLYLLALGDTCVRLVSLIDVRDRGIISDDDLAGRHQFLLAQLQKPENVSTEDASIMRPLRRTG